MKNFEIFVGIDWSGAKSPVNTKSIALAAVPPGNKPPHIYGEIRSRTAVADWIIAMAQKGNRMLIGIDCNFGYAQAIGEQQFGCNFDYKDLWKAVESANVKKPNYFAGGFWTHPDYQRYFWCEGKMPGGFTMPKRLTEITCAENGYGTPESPFKLIGAKQVGKGGLAGMRMAYDLKKKLGSKIAIWPFESDTDEAVIVMTEIYPRQFLRRAGHGNTKIKTYQDLNACLSALGVKNLNPSPTAQPLLRSEASLPSPIGRGRGPSVGWEGEGMQFSDHDADALASAAGLRYLCGTGKTVPETIAHPPMLDEKTAKREGWIFGVGDQ